MGRDRFLGWRTSWAWLAAAALAGCASRPPEPAAVPATAPSAPRPAATSPLAGEQNWMEQLFAGTPVLVEAEPDGAMRVEVPMAHAFDGERATPKPALRAVMDKIALSMFRQPRAQLHIGPPGPAARERLQALRTHMTNKGLPAARLLATAPRQGDTVLLRLAPGPSAIGQLDDRAPPPARTPTAAQPAALTPPSGR